MPELKIGIQLRSLRRPLRESLQIAARLGARAVEIDARGELRPRELSQTGLRQLRKLLDDLGLKVAAVGFRTRRGYDTIDDLEARIRGTKEAMKFAYDLGSNVVVNQVGPVPTDEQSPAWQTMIEALSDLGHHGHHVGALLAAETGTESGADLKRLLRALPEGAIGVNFDPGNLVVNGFSSSDAVTELAAHVIHVHAKDAVRDLAQGRGLEVPLGRGSVDFATLLATLEEQGYRGYFTVERERSEDPINEIAYAVQYLQNL